MSRWAGSRCANAADGSMVAGACVCRTDRPSPARGSRMTWSVAATGYSHRHVIEFLARYIEPGTDALDVGASLGSRPLRSHGWRARGAGGCGASSPIRRISRGSRRTSTATTSSSVVEVHAVALGSRRGTARLGSREYGGGNGALMDADAVDAVEVPVIRIDDVDFPRRVSFVKMDVEGFG